MVVQPSPQSEQEALEQDRKFKEKASKLSLFSDACARTAKMVAVGADTGNKKVAEALLASSGQVPNIQLYTNQRIYYNIVVEETLVVICTIIHFRWNL